MFRIARYIFLLTFFVNLGVWSHLEDQHATIGRSIRDQDHTYPVHIRGAGTYFFSNSIGFYLGVFAPIAFVGSLVLSYLCHLAYKRTLSD